ncbi:MAG: CpaD family pilus assembly protein [Hyphomicrobiaceae bacterium]
MTSQIAPRASGPRPVVAKLLVVSLLALSAAGCKALEEPGAYGAGFTIVDPLQKNPIMVSQQPATLNLRVSRNASGLNDSQRRDVAGFLNHFRNTGMGNTRLVISVPAGSPNEGAATRMMTEIKSMVVDFGFSDTVTVTEPYSAPRGTEAPLRLSYLQYIAEGPACGRWPTNLARQKDNLNYDNFGCAQQRNLAAQIANPADLIGPRSMTTSDSERRAVVIGRYENGENTTATRPPEQTIGTRSQGGF